MNNIPFNRPTIFKDALENFEEILTEEKVGEKKYINKTSAFLKEKNNSHEVYMTSSCTQALEMMAMILRLGSDDEIIIPSFTFVSSAIPFYNRGAKIIYADVDPVNLNIDFESIKSRVTLNTKVVLVIHYGGLACEIEKIAHFCKEQKIILIEDCAHSLGATVNGKHLGSWGDFSCYSFHHSKNLTCGEGGALCVNNPIFTSDQIDVIYNKGTDYHRFLKKEVSFYSWVSPGSNYNMSEITASILYPQLLKCDLIQKRREEIWEQYFQSLSKYAERGIISLPQIDREITSHSCHIFHFIPHDQILSDKLLTYLQDHGIGALRHYYPLHLTKMNNHNSDCEISAEIYTKIIRLPLYYFLADDEISYINKTLVNFFEEYA